MLRQGCVARTVQFFNLETYKTPAEDVYAECTSINLLELKHNGYREQKENETKP